jgi:predicted DNA-binding protein (MmcQ/YjbR family)
MAPRKDPADTAMEELRSFGLTYPGAHTKSPWPGHLDLAVNDKTFAYLSVAGDPFKLSCKLPHSSDDALGLPFVTPTPYGLGKSGWVTAQPPSGPIPIELFKAWIDESYRAQAPKRLVAALESGVPLKKKKAAKKAAAKPAKTARSQPQLKRAPGKKRRAKAKPAVRARRPG